MAEIEAVRREVIALKGQGASVLADVADMRARLAAAKPAEGPWDAKRGAGRMMDVELYAQVLALQSASPARQIERQVQAGVKAAKASDSDAQAVLSAFRLYWRLHAGARLLSDRIVDPASLGEGAQAFLLREVGEATVPDLTARLAEATAVVDRVIATHLGDTHGETGDGSAAG
jgi:glutamate-ammonia-ligase adenylyltransferase